MFDPPTTTLPEDQAPLAEVEAALTEGAGHQAAAACRWLELLADFDRRGGWAESGVRSCAHWLTWHCAMDLATAREHVKVAARLADLPLLHAAFARGELSWWQVRLVARVALPHTEEALVDLARHATATQLRRVCAGLTQALAAEHPDRHRRRHLSCYVDDDGFLVISGRLTPEEGALVARALDAITKQLRAIKREKVRAALADVPSVPEDPPGETEPRVDSVSASRADALVAMARAALAKGTPALRDRAQVVLHVTSAALAAGPPGPTQDGTAPGRDPARADGPATPHDAAQEPANDSDQFPAHEPPPLCELEEGPPVDPATARRLACDASVVTLVEDPEGLPLSVGRRTRTVPAPLRRALRARDRGCRFPGCPEQRFVEAHHIEHWAHGGPTAIANLVELCLFHHRLVHEGGWGIGGRAPHLTFLRPDGSPLDPLPARAGPFDGDLAARNRARGVGMDPSTIVSRWCGERLDRGYVVSVFMQPPPKERPERTPPARPDG